VDGYTAHKYIVRFTVPEINLCFKNLAGVNQAVFSGFRPVPIHQNIRIPFQIPL
jgi:hypothetical protein